MDLVGWDYDAYAYVIGELKKFFKEENLVHFGSVEYIPVSALEGQNINKPLTNPKASWWAGGTLFDALSKIFQLILNKRQFGK